MKRFFQPIRLTQNYTPFHDQKYFIDFVITLHNIFIINVHSAVHTCYHTVYEVSITLVEEYLEFIKKIPK